MWDYFKPGAPDTASLCSMLSCAENQTTVILGVNGLFTNEIAVIPCQITFCMLSTVQMICGLFQADNVLK